MSAGRGRAAARALHPLSADDQLTPVVADGGPLGAREFVASLGLRDGAAPRVVGAMIGSIDGHATLAGRAGGLGNPADRALLRELRTAADALLVGRNTLTTERYATVLDPDQREARTALGRTDQPVVATLSRRPALLADVPLIAEPDVDVIIYAPPGAEPVAGAQLCELDDVSVAAVVIDLHERLGAQLIVCEGGPSLLRDLAAAGVLDDLVLTLAPLLVSGDGPSILSGAVLDEPLAMTLAHAARAGDHLMLHYRA